MKHLIFLSYFTATSIIEHLEIKFGFWSDSAKFRWKCRVKIELKVLFPPQTQSWFREKRQNCWRIRDGYYSPGLGRIPNRNWRPVLHSVVHIHYWPTTAKPTSSKYINIQCEFAFFFYIVSINQQVNSNSQLSFENLPLNGDERRKEEWHTGMVQRTKSFFFIGWRTAERCRGLVTAERGLEKRCRVYESRWPGLPAAWLLSLRSTVPEQQQTHTRVCSHILNAGRVHWNADKHATTQRNQFPLWQWRSSFFFWGAPPLLFFSRQTCSTYPLDLGNTLFGASGIWICPDKWDFCTRALSEEARAPLPS